MENFQLQGLEMPVRLTKWLQDHFKISYAYAQHLIRKGAIRVDGTKIKNDCKVANDDTVTLYAKISIQDIPKKQLVPEKLLAGTAQLLKENVLFKDDHVMAINKPAGLATQGGSGVKISVDDVLDYLKFGLEVRPRLVHRLDKDTTGILLLARTKRAAIELAEQFKNNSVSKKYLALVAGRVLPVSGVIKGEIAKFGSDGPAKEAITKYRVISHKDGLTLVEFMPVTGRTHQIRIHAAKFLNAPIVGDAKYGGKIALVESWKGKGVCLHAYEIEIKNLFGKKYRIKAPVCGYMEEFLP